MLGFFYWYPTIGWFTYVRTKVNNWIIWDKTTLGFVLTFTSGTDHSARMTYSEFFSLCDVHSVERKIF